MSSATPTSSWKVLGVAKVLYPYSAQGSTELNIAVGDKVNVIEKYPNGWWVGELNGKVGVFPGAYVSLEEETPGEKDNSEASKKAENNDENKAATSSPASTDTPLRPAGLLRARALYDFNRTTASELSFKFNDELVITEKLDGGWWRAELNGKTGLVPKNYLQELTSPTTSLTQPAVASVVAASRDRESSDAFGVASTKMRTSVVDVTPMPENRLSSTGVVLGINNNSSAANNPRATINQPGASYLFKVRALYDFPGKEPNHLPIKKGAIIPVKLVPADGNPWWLGELDGRKGYFPMNYVQKIAENEEMQATPTVDVVEEPKVQLRATFDFVGRTATELSFTKGQSITLVKKLQPEGGWWKGEILDSDGTKRVGNFPSNYVTVVDEKNEPPALVTQPAHQETHRANDTTEATDEHQTPEKVFVWAIESYSASSLSELSFKKGDKIEVIEEAKQDGWAQGEKDGQRGYFPYSFVTPNQPSVDEPPPPPPEEEYKQSSVRDESTQEEDEKKRLEEERVRHEEELKVLQEQETKRQEEEHRRQEEVRMHQEEEKKRQLEEERIQQEELRLQHEAAERQRLEEERQKHEEEEKARREEEEHNLQVELQSKREEEETRQREEEQRRQEEERRLQEESRQQQEEARRQEELRLQEELRRKVEEEEARRQEEQRRQLEEQQKMEEEERKRQAEARQQEVKQKEEELLRKQREHELNRQREEEELQRKREELEKKEQELRRQREEVEKKNQLAETQMKRVEAQTRLSPSSSLTPSPSTSPTSPTSITELPKVNIPKVTRPLPVPKPRRNVPSGGNELQTTESIIRSLERKLQVESEARRQLEAKVAQLETKLETLSKAFAELQSSSPANLRSNLRPTGRDLTR